MTPTQDTDPSTSDRRRSPRMSVALPARVVGADSTHAAETVDISEDGVLLSGADFPPGSQIRLEVELAEAGWHSLDAEVVRREEAANGDDRLAARFARIATEGGRGAIQAFFEARMGQAAPASRRSVAPDAEMAA